jgi:DnaJ homolog subfamily C member 2
MPTISKLSSITSWPDDVPTTEILCAGEGFVGWESNLRCPITIDEAGVIDGEDIDESDILGRMSSDVEEKIGQSRDLSNLSAAKLERLNFYQCLGNLPLHATPEQVRKAYYKACLLYHPDKTGRGEDDEVFLKIKAAFDTLMDEQKRRAYDSQLPFDDSIPRGSESTQEFFDLYRPVFERNLRFDNRLKSNGKESQLSRSLSGSSNNSNSKNKSKKKNKSAKDNDQRAQPPSLGDDDTPLDQVHAFYEYWIHFESWRDFSLEAATLTNNANFDLDTVDSRYEKRFLQKEIDRKAKALKRDEMARINLLVERAMAADPRLKREKQKVQEEKERIERERREAIAKKRQEEQERLEAERKEREEQETREKENKAIQKAEKEKQKKLARKAKANLRKLCIAAHGTGKTYWTSLEHMYDDLDYLCEKLETTEIGELSQGLGDPDNLCLEGVETIKDKIVQLKEGRKSPPESKKQGQSETENGSNPGIMKQSSTGGSKSDAWTESQDKQLMDGLSKFPATMDKNERWGNIANGVTGKSKKECVERFKAIRESLKKAK